MVSQWLGQVAGGSLTRLTIACDGQRPKPRIHGEEAGGDEHAPLPREDRAG